MRVVQPPPGPMPTLTPSAPRSTRNRAPSAVATLPAIISTSPKRLRNSRHRALHHDRMAVRDVDDDDVDVGANQLGGALEIVAGRADGRADAQPALGVARRERHPALAHEVPRGDQAEQHAVGVDERQLLDLALDHEPLGRRRIERGRGARPARASGVMRSATRDPARVTKRMSRSVSSPCSRRSSSTTTSVPTRDLRHQRRRPRRATPTAAML